MRENSVTPRRRTVLAGISATVLGSAIGTATAGGTDKDEEFVLQQGGDCVKITPLEGDQPVEDFYDWDEGATDYSAVGPQHLQRPETSVLFLYRGPHGRLSLVVIHGAYDPDESFDVDEGGSISMTFSDLPDDAEWLVQDDLYDGPTNYDVWQTDEPPHEVDWTWAGNRTDGGVLTSLGHDPLVRIAPDFNDRAALAGQYYDGEVTDWEVLTGDLWNPERLGIALNEPVVIGRGECDGVVPGGSGPVPVDASVEGGVVDHAGEGTIAVDLEFGGGVTVGDVDRSSIRADPGGASPVENDAASDGSVLRLYFPVDELDLPNHGSVEIVVTGRLNDGRTLEGSDSIDVSSIDDTENLEGEESNLESEQEETAEVEETENGTTGEEVERSEAGNDGSGGNGGNAESANDERGGDGGSAEAEGAQEDPASTGDGTDATRPNPARRRVTGPIPPNRR